MYYSSCYYTDYDIITKGIVQRPQFNMIADLKLWVWVSISPYIKVYCMDVQMYEDQRIVSLQMRMLIIINSVQLCTSQRSIKTT